MPFLTTDDYKKQIKLDVKDVITNADAAIITAAETAAQEEISGYIRNRYDVDTIFAAAGGARHPMIILYMVDIVLYHTHSRITPRDVPEVRQIRYDQAVEWLNKVAKGLINPGLPIYDPAPTADNPTSSSSYGHSNLNWEI